MSQHKSQGHGILRSIRRIIPFWLMGPLRWFRDRITPAGRVRLWLERNRGEQLMQPSPTTKFDRHPEFFKLAQQRLSASAAPRLLSFGCSTGEEAVTLAHYLSNAAIDAIDINPRSIAIARQRAAARQLTTIRFECSGSPPEGKAIYDAIFCLSVLRHGSLEIERRENCAGVLPFSRFAETIEALDHALKPGGLLFLWGCNFRFSDTEIAKGYRPIASPQKRAQSGFFYGRDNRLLPIASVSDFVFEKLGNSEAEDARQRTFDVL